MHGKPGRVLEGRHLPVHAPSRRRRRAPATPTLGTTINFYNSADQLTATTDALGNTTTYSYTSGVSGVPNGLQYCSVDPVDYQKSVTCPAYGAAHVTGTATATFDSAGDQTASDRRRREHHHLHLRRDRPSRPGRHDDRPRRDGHHLQLQRGRAGHLDRR